MDFPEATEIFTHITLLHRSSVLLGSQAGAVCSQCVLLTVLAEIPKRMWLNLHVCTSKSMASCNFATYWS